MSRVYTVTPAIDRFLAKVDRSGECWLWTGALTTNGYGSFMKKKGLQMVRAHRFSYEYFVGPIPEGLDLDHLCRVRNCVNPAHLEPVTRRINLLRGMTQTALNASKTHCPAGHPYSPENTYIRPKGQRVCKACSNLRSRANYQRDRDRINAERRAKRRNTK